ncbi:MFS transporter [Saccharopolyspora oryzae]|uniref:MFS transporter n=1 Tax=Saccharopolyspora oryzae TaxID=2997343 RepID=A0ABT4V144_9PSEU|nr:MFS transporter [Saccharopolyspora oryzae]MDA3627658.1 MFS transporter [Saccharopolyspora oryzae]
MMRLADVGDYRKFWTASTTSIFGTYITSLALQVLAAVTLHATATELGLLNAARWLPYLLLGLFVGVLVDRYRSKPMLVGADLARAALLCAIPLLHATGLLTLPVLIAFAALLGVLSLFFDAADQAFLPRLVPVEMLTSANARLEQSHAVAQTTGPLLAAALVKAIGAPLAILVDALSYLISGVLLARIRTREHAAPLATRRSVLTELREGTAWVYRHRMLAPQALAGHLWWLAHSMLSTILVVYVLRAPDDGLGLDEVQLGITYACAGAGAVLGGALANRSGQRFGAGRTVVTTRLLMPLPWLLIPLTGPSPLAIVVLGTSQLLFWVLMGLEGPNEMAYRQAITPERLQGRVNTTIRSLNRGAIVVGAPIGGLIADAAGYRVSLWVGIAGLIASAAVLAASPVRHATIPTSATLDAQAPT